jgi:hypothetical protein
VSNPSASSRPPSPPTPPHKNPTPEPLLPTLDQATPPPPRLGHPSSIAAAVFYLRPPVSISLTATSPTPSLCSKLRQVMSIAPLFVSVRRRASSPCLCAPPLATPPPHGASRHSCRSRLLDHLDKFPVTPAPRRIKSRPNPWPLA